MITILIMLLPTLYAAPMTPVTLPNDEGAHHQKIEWWYYTGHLDTVDGGVPRKYAFENTVFKDEAVIFGRGKAFVGHFALIDVDGQKHYPVETLGLAEATSTEVVGAFDFHFRKGTWVMRGSQGADRLEVSAADTGVTLDLTSTKPVVLWGDHGVIDYGGVVKLAYYSRTRMLARGEVYDHGVRRKVQGFVWMDHQWGDADTKKFKWKWFSAHLDDGRDVMFFEVWRRKPKKLLKSYAAIVLSDGTVEEMPEWTVEVTDEKYWKKYPIETRLEAPGHGISLVNRALFADQRFRVSRPWQFIPVYWEGACEITGTINELPVHGRGFTEFAGYE